MTANHTGPDPKRIRSMFAAISHRYDRANTVLSVGVHHVWRRIAVRWADVRPGDRVLDCATGTGDLAIAFHKVVGAQGQVIGTDFVPEMLEVARRKAPAISFEVADVMALPFESGSFDVVSIAFGIRNVSDPLRGIAEMARVVKPGGRVIVLEFGQPPNALFRRLYDFYRIRFLPLLGGAITGKKGAYEYLEESASRFPCGEAFEAWMRSSASFTRIETRRLSFGIAYLYRGVKA